MASPTRSDSFFEGLEGALEPFSDEEVDKLMDATEADFRYRAEIGLLYVLAMAVPISVLLLGLYPIYVFSLQGWARFIGLGAALLLMYAAIRSFKIATARYVRWRYQASFLRQLAAAEARRGR